MSTTSIYQNLQTKKGSISGSQRMESFFLQINLPSFEKVLNLAIFHRQLSTGRTYRINQKEKIKTKNQAKIKRIKDLSLEILFLVKLKS